MSFLNKSHISNLRRILVCIALLAYGMQSFAFTGESSVRVSSVTMPGCHMNMMNVNDANRVDVYTYHETVVKSNCCMSDQCENSCSMTNCSYAPALISTVSLPWFIMIKPSRHTFDVTSFVHYPSSFFRPPISS